MVLVERLVCSILQLLSGEDVWNLAEGFPSVGNDLQLFLAEWSLEVGELGDQPCWLTE